MKDKYIRVLLDNHGTIKKFECTLPDGDSYDESEVLGKNWFDVFIGQTDKDSVMSVFKALFRKSEDWVSYENDIICKNGKHKLINFHNKLIKIDGEIYLNCIGVEHYNACNLLNIVTECYLRD